MKMKIYHHSGKKTLRENLDKASFPFSLLKYPWHFLSKGKKSTLTPKCLTRILNIFHILQKKKSRLCITKLERIKLEPAANPSPEPDIGRHIRSRGKICRVEGGAGAVVTFNTGVKNYPIRKLHDLPVPNFFSSETHWGRNAFDSHLTYIATSFPWVVLPMEKYLDRGCKDVSVIKSSCSSWRGQDLSPRTNQTTYNSQWL